MNVRLLRRIQKKILAEPKQFVMQQYFQDGRIEKSNIKIPNCGTAACIGGWACTLTLKLNPLFASKKFVGNNLLGEGEMAKEALRLTEDQRYALFHFMNWPSKFRLVKTEGTPAFARQAVARIDHFIKTKGAE